MSGYGRQIAVGAFTAVLAAVGLALGAGYYLPTQAAQSTLTTIATATSVITATETSALTATAASTATTTSGTSTQTASVSSATQYSTTTAVATTSCVKCSRLYISSANLTVMGATSQTFLSLIIKNGGLDRATNVTVTLSAAQIVTVPSLNAGDQTQLSILIPSRIGIESGQSYQLGVSAHFGTSLIETSTTVIASQE